MTPKERADLLNRTGRVHAQLNADNLITVYADYAPAFLKAGAADWVKLFIGGRFSSVKLELEALDDDDLKFLGDAMEIQHLNLKGNKRVSGELLVSLPDQIGLKTLDIARTSISNRDIITLHKFPKLETVYGHKNQFSSDSIAAITFRRPELNFRLIY